MLYNLGSTYLINGVLHVKLSSYDNSVKFLYKVLFDDTVWDIPDLTGRFILSFFVVECATRF